MRRMFFALGMIAVGVGVGFLVAPVTGKEARKWASRAAEDLSERGQKFYKQAEEAIGKGQKLAMKLVA